MPAFSGCAPRLQRMIPVPEPRKGSKCIPKSAPLRPRGGMWETGQETLWEKEVLNHLTTKPRALAKAPNQCDCNQLEASCIQQSRQKHAICKMHVKINNNNNNTRREAEWECKTSNPCCFQTGRLSLTPGCHWDYMTKDPRTQGQE